MTDALHDGYALECREVTYRLPSGATLVSGLNLRVAQGETLVLLGRSGSGKTTTLKLINRLLEPSEGAVLVENRPTTEWDPIHLRRGIGYVIQIGSHSVVGRFSTKTEWDPIHLRRGIGYVIQEAGLFPHLTV